jgi:hypothetical protein
MGDNGGLPRTARVGVPSMSALLGSETIRSARSPVYRLCERRLTRAWAYDHNRPAESFSNMMLEHMITRLTLDTANMGANGRMI